MEIRHRLFGIGEIWICQDCKICRTITRKVMNVKTKPLWVKILMGFLCQIEVHLAETATVQIHNITVHQTSKTTIWIIKTQSNPWTRIQVTFCKIIKIRFNKCNNKVLFRDERISLRGRDFWTIRLIILMIFKIWQMVPAVMEVEAQLLHRRWLTIAISVRNSKKIPILIMSKNLINHHIPTQLKKCPEETKETN